MFSSANSDEGDFGGLLALGSSPVNAEEDPAKAGKDFEEQMKKAASDQARLDLLVTRALALNLRGRKQELSLVLERLFNLADQMFRQSVDEKPAEKWSKRPGVFALSMIAQICANSIPEVVLERIRNLRMVPLRAHLLVRLARSLAADGPSGDSGPSERRSWRKGPVALNHSAAGLQPKSFNHRGHKGKTS